MTYPQTVVGQFAVGRGRHLVATVATMHGSTRIDLREWIEAQDPSGQLYPTRRGINMRADYAEQLVRVAYALCTAVQPSAIGGAVQPVADVGEAAEEP